MTDNRSPKPKERNRNISDLISSIKDDGPLLRSASADVEPVPETPEPQTGAIEDSAQQLQAETVRYTGDPGPPLEDSRTQSSPQFPLVWTISLLVLGVAAIILVYAVLDERLNNLHQQIMALQQQVNANGDEQHQTDTAAPVGLADQLAALETGNMDLSNRIDALEKELPGNNLQVQDQLTPQQELATQFMASQQVVSGVAADEHPQEPESLNPAAGNGNWFINIGTFSSRSVANDLASRIKVSVALEVIPVSAGNKQLYRVRAIGLKTKEAADSLVSTVRSNYGLTNIWVGEDPIRK